MKKAVLLLVSILMLAACACGEPAEPANGLILSTGDETGTYYDRFGMGIQPTGCASIHTRRSLIKAPVISERHTPLSIVEPNLTTGTYSSYI